ncbi:MAG TPA: ABC transporter ATP-binding protein [Kineosporiaceae bacterium]|nr:ABC transporter ATP-binding protein [Kineosporiaceae bacterium]
MTTHSTQPAVEAERLTRRFGGPQGFAAVREVSFRVHRGELFALLGTNGAGKTSTMEVLEGLAQPSGGTVRVLGHDPYLRRRAIRPRVGIMLQEGGLPQDLTATETAAMWAGTLSAPRPVLEALQMVGLAHRAEVRVRQLSGGERRRLDLALAVLGRPDVLFLDEPTTGLDPESRHGTWELVRRLKQDGATVLLTTHHLEEAEELADRLAIMHGGRIVATGTPDEVARAHPARVRFTLPDGVGPQQLPHLPGAHPGVTSADPLITVRTDALQDTLTALLSWAAGQGITLGRLEARPASLEEAFLAIAAGRAADARTADAANGEARTIGAEVTA